jgi:hypothetical protein
MSERVIRVFCIGPDGTEMYAGSSRQDVEDYYAAQLAAEVFDDEIRELSDVEIDAEHSDTEGPAGSTFTFRKLAQEATEWPTQISSGYN